MDTKKVYWTRKYCYLKGFTAKVQIHVSIFGTHICNSGTDYGSAKTDGNDISVKNYRKKTCV